MFSKLGNKLASWRSRHGRFAAIERSLAEGWSPEAFEALRALAVEGDAAAQHRLGAMYENAEGVVQSLTDAAHWYRLAGAQGYLPAQARLGLLYFIDPPSPACVTAGAEATAVAPALPGGLAQFFPHGVSVSQDFAEALKWNLLAAEQGVAQAMTALGELHAGLWGGEPDLAKATHWLSRAAELGEERAAAILAESKPSAD